MPEGVNPYTRDKVPAFDPYDTVVGQVAYEASLATLVQIKSYRILKHLALFSKFSETNPVFGSLCARFKADKASFIKNNNWVVPAIDRNLDTSNPRAFLQQRVAEAEVYDKLKARFGDSFFKKIVIGNLVEGRHKIAN